MSPASLLDLELRTDMLFHALGDATRRDIIRVTLAEEHSVSSLARRYPMSFAAVQKHVAVLERSGIVTKRSRGREQLVCGNIETARAINALLAEFETIWRGRVERMADLLAQEHSDAASPAPADNTDTQTGAPDERN